MNWLQSAQQLLDDLAPELERRAAVGPRPLRVLVAKPAQTEGFDVIVGYHDQPRQQVQQLPRALEVPFQGARRQLPVRNAVARPLDLGQISRTAATLRAASQQVEIESGALLRQVPDGPFGTLGWSFIHGSHRRLLGNYHVLGKAGAARVSVDLGSSLRESATVDRWFVPVLGVPNRWDLAMARYDRDAQPVPRFRAVDVSLPYPRAVVQSLDASAEYGLIGATSGSTGRLFAVGRELQVDLLGDGASYDFTDQLYFQGEGGAMSAGGDSGAVVVDIGKGAVAGLCFGVATVDGATLTVANPLHMLGWSVTGEQDGLPVIDGGQMPPAH